MESRREIRAMAMGTLNSQAWTEWDTEDRLRSATLSRESRLLMRTECGSSLIEHRQVESGPHHGPNHPLCQRIIQHAIRDQVVDSVLRVSGDRSRPPWVVVLFRSDAAEIYSVCGVHVDPDIGVEQPLLHRWSNCLHIFFHWSLRRFAQLCR